MEFTDASSTRPAARQQRAAPALDSTRLAGVGRRPMAPLAFLAAALVFGVLVTANSAGYRYGASDQAFYIPAIQRSLSPALFPHDAALLDSQARLTVIDEAIASLSAATGWPLPQLFFAAFVLTVLLFTGAVALVGTGLRHSPAALAAFGLAVTLRHRVAGTGVNTFEGYFHPRVLAFAVGATAIGLLLHRRHVAALCLAGVAMLIHPTTGSWFAVWLVVAIASTRRWTRAAALGAAALGIAIAAVAWAVFPGVFGQMDRSWVAAVAEKDYLFPSAWNADVWLMNALAPVAVVGVFLLRRRRGLCVPFECGLVVGCLALVAVFAATLPLVEQRIAIAVQLQVSRVLWLVEFFATAYLAWLLVDAPRHAGAAPAPWRAVAVPLVLLLFAAGRGAYVLRVEHDRPLVAIDVPHGPWRSTAEWAARHTPVDANFLVDPEHALKYGVSFRVAAQRDVFLEEVKDSAIATYSREIAARVAERVRLLPRFEDLTAETALALACSHDLDFVIAERLLPLPLVYSNGQFRVHSLAGRSGRPCGGSREPVR